MYHVHRTYLPAVALLAGMLPLLSLSGCGGSDGGSASGTGGGGASAAEGEACKRGGDCGDDLYCARPSLNDGDEGRCAKLPDACASSAECSDACSDALHMTCQGSSQCSSDSGKITYGCKEGMATEGQACAEGKDCVAGLYCKVTSSDGVCTALPAECNGTPDCSGDCGLAINALCGPGGSVCDISSLPSAPLTSICN